MHKNFHELVVDAVSVVVAKNAIVGVFYTPLYTLAATEYMQNSHTMFLLDYMFCILLKDAVVSDNCGLQSFAIFRRRSINVG